MVLPRLVPMEFLTTRVRWLGADAGENWSKGPTQMCRAFFVGTLVWGYTAPLKIEATKKTRDKQVEGVAGLDEKPREVVRRWTSATRRKI